MKLVLEFFTVLIVVILPQVIFSFYSDRIRNILNQLPDEWMLISSFLNPFGVILMVLYIAVNVPDGLRFIGLSLAPAEISKTLVVAGLVTGYLSLIFVFSKLRSADVQAENMNMQRQILEMLGFSKAGGFGAKLLSLIRLWLGVICEELVYHGYLVLFLGAHTGSFAPAILLSITFSVLIHLYQGFNWKVVYAHTFFAVVFIVAIMTTRNLFAALIPHLVYDTVWLFRGWRSMSVENVKQSEVAAS